MTVTVQDILKLLISTGVLGAAFLWWINRPKQKKEMALILGDTYSKMLEGQKEYIAQLDERIDRQGEWIDELKKDKDKYKVLIEQLTKDNDECKYQHGVVELDMLQLKKQNNFKIWKRDMVFVIDDDEEVLQDFKHKFAKISVLDYEGFHNVDEFMREVKKIRPAIVVLDYRLSHGKTAEDVIKDLGYEPEVFIMSGEAGYEKRFVGKKVRFFLKDDHYVYKIAMAIIKHLTDNN